MGQSKGGGYKQMPTLSGDQSSTLNQILSMIAPNMQQAAAGFQQFLPGGGGGQPIIDAAQQRYQQQTIPNILESLGGGTKGSSALNQALASSAANLNTDLGAQLAQMQLSAAQGLGQLGTAQGGLGLGTNTFNYLQRQPPLWQQLLTGLLGSAGQAGVGFATGYGSTFK